MSNSGSSANLLMVAALFYTKDNPLKPGDEVIVPSVSWSTTYFPLQQYGLRLRFVDIDLETLNYDLDKFSSAITPKTRVVMVVNLLGNPNNFEAIRSAIGDNNISLIEDNCESLGAEYKGQKLALSEKWAHLVHSFLIIFQQWKEGYSYNNDGSSITA